MNFKSIIPYIIIGVLISVLFFQNCSGEQKEPVPIEVPEIDNDLPAQIPEHVKPNDPPVEIKWETKTITVENPIKEELALLYQQTKDSLDRYKMYLDAIQIRDFTSSFEDDYLKLNVSGKVQGEVKEITPKYTIKTREVQTSNKQEETVFRFLAGIEAGNTLLFDDPSFRGNLGFQNAKGNILRVGYDTEKRIWIGYDFSVFKIKK